VVATTVQECTDDKSLPKITRKQLQIEHAKKISTNAKLVKLADKLSNIGGIDRDPPKEWSKQEIEGYILWSFMVCREMKGTSPFLEENLWYIFEKHGILSLTEEQLQEGLKNYYSVIDHSE